MRIVWRPFLLAAVALALTGCVAVGALVASDSLKDNAMNVTGHTASIFAPQDSRGQTNILILGTGGPGHTGPDLTDTIMIASIDSSTESVALVSLPRDLYAPSSEVTRPTKINELYAGYKRHLIQSGLSQTGASMAALSTLETEISNRLGIPLQGTVKVDFAAFKGIIDAMGGIDIYVEKDLYDSLYPVEEGVLGTIQITEGFQHMDGEMALAYARSRNTTSDFDRSNRQQKVIAAIADKLKTGGVFENLKRMQPALEAIKGHVEWTFSDASLPGILGSMLAVRQENILKFHMNVGTGGDYSDATAAGLVYRAPETVATGYYVLPLAASHKPNDWSKIQTFFSLLTRNRGQYLHQPTISIATTSRAKVQAQRLKNELLRYGFKVEEKTEVIKEAQKESAMHVKATAATRYGFFSDFAGIDAESAVANQQTDILIAVGDDYKFEGFDRHE